MNSEQNLSGSKFRRNSKLAPLSQPRNPDLQPFAYADQVPLNTNLRPPTNNNN
jgi:hypothetical protein